MWDEMEDNKKWEWYIETGNKRRSACFGVPFASNMFSSGSPYSPFFTSGLFVASAVPDDTPVGPRRGSLPTDSLSTRAPAPATASYYATQKEYRSFLSLDLAESRKSKCVLSLLVLFSS